MSEIIIEKTAQTSVPISSLIANRWSPRIFDSSHVITDAEILQLLEAARWAPSANNSQPWAFIVGRRGDEAFGKLVAALSGFNQSWAPNASTLILALGPTHRPDGAEADPGFLRLNIGLATSQIVFEAESLGYKAHYMAGFVPDILKTEFQISDYEPLLILAIGKQGDAALVDEELAVREAADRTRKSLDEIVLIGLPESGS